MTTHRNFQVELQEARLIASRIAADLTALGIPYNEIDVKQAGMLPQWKRPLVSI